MNNMIQILGDIFTFHEIDTLFVIFMLKNFRIDDLSTKFRIQFRYFYCLKSSMLSISMTDSIRFVVLCTILFGGLIGIGILLIFRLSDWLRGLFAEVISTWCNSKDA